MPGNKARLESFEIPATTGRCVEFMYHMYGKGKGVNINTMNDKLTSEKLNSFPIESGKMF